MRELDLKDYRVVIVDNDERLACYNRVRLDLRLETKTIIEHPCCAWLIVDKHTSDYVGYINVVPCNLEEREIGFVLLAEQCNKGVMSQVLPAFVRALGEQLYTETSVENQGAIRVLKKSGFVQCQSEHSVHITPYGETVQTVAFRNSISPKTT